MAPSSENEPSDESKQLRGIAHDLKNVMQAVLISSERLPSVTEQAEEIHKISQSLEKLITDQGLPLVLQLSALARGMQPSSATIALQEVLKAAVLSFECSAGPMAITYHEIPDPKACLLPYDKSEFMGALLRFWIALRDCPSTPKAISIRLHQDSTKGWILEHQIAWTSPLPDDLVQEFHLLWKSGFAAYAQRISQGWVAAEGAMLKCCMPLESLLEPQPQETSSGPAEIASPGQSTSWALVVDDEACILRAFSDILSNNGFQVLAAPTAKEIRESLEPSGCAPSLAIVDYHLPDANGLHFCRELNKAFPGIALFLATGSAIEDIEEHGDLPLQVLSKPIRLRALQQAISPFIPKG